MELDKDLLARQEARAMAKQAERAQCQLARMDQGQIDKIVEAVAVEAIIADIKNTKSVQKHKNFLHTFCIKENVNIHYIQNL